MTKRVFLWVLLASVALVLVGGPLVNLVLTAMGLPVGPLPSLQGDLWPLIFGALLGQ